MELIDASIKIIDVSKDSISTFGIEGFSFELNEFKIDSSTILKPKRVSYKTFSCGSGHCYLYLSDDYDFKMGDFSYNSTDKIFKFEDINVSHNLSKKGYLKETEDDTPYYDISLGKLAIDLSTVDPITDSVLLIKKVSLEELSVFVAQSKLKRIRIPSRKPLIANMIRSIKIPILIDEIELSDGLFTYEFREKIMKGQSVTVMFSHSNILIENITNIDTFLMKNQYMTVAAESSFMDKGKVDLRMSFDLRSEIERFTVNGHMGTMAFTDANSIVEKLAPVTFVGGKVHNVDFNFVANKYNANGFMDFSYEDVRLNVLKSDSPKRENKPVMSMLLNNYLKKNNMPNTNKYKRGTISVNFDQHKSILNYLWQSVKSGLFSSLARSKKK